MKRKTDDASYVYKPEYLFSQVQIEWCLLGHLLGEGLFGQG